MTGGAPGADSLTGRTLGGHYLVGEPLGAGAMGVVYRVRHTLLRKDFAAKVLSASLAGDAEARVRFMREAEGLSRITHPNVVSVRHFGEEDELLYLVMDLCEGETLRDLLLREGALPAERAVPIALQILQALDAAHWEGVVHRDLKPANILVSAPDPERGGPERVRVVDFGLARVAPRSPLPGHLSSVPGTVAGTVAYMSPEQVRGDADVDARSDLFSLGAVLHEMLGGRPPFEGSSTLTVAMGILERPPAPLPGDGPRGVAAPVRAVLGVALEKDRDRRFRTAAEMADALRGAVAGTAPGAAPSTRPGRGRRVVAAGAALGLFALATFAANRYLFPVPGDYDSASAGADRERALRSFLDARFEAAAAAAGRVVDSEEATPEDILLLGRARSGIEDRRALGDFDRAEALLGSDPRPGTEMGRFHIDRELRDFDAAGRELDRVLARGQDPDALYRHVWYLHLRFVEVGADAPSPAGRGEALDRMAADARALGGDPRRGVAEALEAWGRGDLDGAHERARQASERHPDLAEAPFVSAWIFIRRGRPELRPADADSSRRWYEKALLEVTESIARARRRPDYLLQGRDLVRSWRLSCDVKQALGDKEGAAADFVNELIARNPGNRYDNFIGAQYLQWAGRFADALEAYAAARRAGESDRILHGEGYCRMQLGRTKAEAGDLAGALGELDQSVAKFTAGVALDPGNPVHRAYRAEAWLTMARIQRDEASAGCLEKAREDFAALEAAGMAGSPEVLFRRWEYFETLGDRAAALADIRAAIAFGMYDTAAHHRRLAFSCIANASGPGARALLEEGILAAREAERWSPQRAELCRLLQGDAHVALALLERDPAPRARELAAATEDYARADSLAHLDPRIRAEARLRASAARLAAGDPADAVREAEAALRLRLESNASSGSSLFANDYYLRSPLASFHRRLAEAYSAADRPEDAARQSAIAGALK